MTRIHPSLSPATMKTYHYYLNLLCLVIWIEGIPGQGTHPSSPSVMPVGEGGSIINIISPQPSRPPSRPTISPQHMNMPTISFRSSDSLNPSTMPSISAFPSTAPSWAPSLSSQPSISASPSHLPSNIPTYYPTASSSPSTRPSQPPSMSQQPSTLPSSTPTLSAIPSSRPSDAPTESQAPSIQPTVSNAPSMSMQPSSMPSDTPSAVPSESASPSTAPSLSNAPSFSFSPSDVPSDQPSDFPSNFPSVSPYPSARPTIAPTGEPSISPSDYPSSPPSQSPTLVPIETPLAEIGMTLNGLVSNELFRNKNWLAQWENLTSYHVKSFWNSVDRSGTEVFEVNTTFITFNRLPKPAPTRSPRLRQLQATDISDVFPNASVPHGFGPNATFLPQSSNATDSPIGNETIFPTNITTVPSGSPSPMATLNLTTSAVPTISNAPSAKPTISTAPSFRPSSSAEPSQRPTAVPEPHPVIIWYSQTIKYGVVYNDSRMNTVDELFQWPFLFDQKRYTNAIVSLTHNQLPIYVDPLHVDVRIGSSMPSIQPTGFPSGAPSAAPSRKPTKAPIQPAVDNTSLIIVAVTVPVAVVLLIAFAGIVYVTRDDSRLLEASDISFEGDVIPLSAQDTRTQGGGDTSSTPGSYNVAPGITTSELVMEPSDEQQAHPLRRPSSGRSGISSSHPGVVTTSRRSPSHTSVSSELTAAESMRGRAQGFPGFMSPTGTGTSQPSRSALLP